MALWAKAQQLPPATLQQIQSIYVDHFPIEVRHFLAYWIDAQNWTAINPDYQQHEPVIKELLARFIREIQDKANSFNGEDLFVTKLKFTETANLFKQRYESNPIGLYRSIRNCLLNEMNLVQQTESMLNPQMMDRKNTSYSYCNPSFVKINQDVEVLKKQTKENGDIVTKFIEEQESFSLKYFKYQEVKEELKSRLQIMNGQAPPEHLFTINKLNEQIQQREAELQQRIGSLTNLQFHIIERLEKISFSIGDIITRVLDNELLAWKRSQQLAGNGSDFDTSHLDILQTWYEGLAEILWGNLTQVKETRRVAGVVASVIPDSPMIVSRLTELNAKFNKYFTTIVYNTFILEKQPPQVMKTNTRFSAKVRFLVGGKLNVNLSPPQVKVSIISESQANYLFAEKALRGDGNGKSMRGGEGIGEILNNTGTMEYDNTSKQLSITFRNMQLKKIKRAEKKGSESVVDEKFALLFSSQFSVGDQKFEVWTLSLPVTVIVHGNQEPHAWATITWDNAFAEQGRKPFVVPEKVTWGKITNALNLKFNAVTGRPLSNDNMKYLAEKLFRTQCPNDEYDTMTVTWSQFSKESLPDRSFTFWDWFYAVMKLTKEHLKPLWTEGYILGFLRKQDAENMLSTCPNGTFLLRFSDSELGGITIAWVGGTGDQKEVIMLQPFTAKDFAIRSLADRLNDLNHLLYLYPDIPKEKAFGRHYTPISETQCVPGGYVKPLLVTHVPGWGGLNQPNTGMSTPLQGGMHSYPTTPHSMFHPNSPGDTTSVMSEPVDRFETLPQMDYGGFDSMDFKSFEF